MVNTIYDCGVVPHRLTRAGSLSPTLRRKQSIELMCELCSPIGISFKTYPYHVLYDTLMHPAFLLDGRIFLNHNVLEDICVFVSYSYFTTRQGKHEA